MLNYRACERERLEARRRVHQRVETILSGGNGSGSHVASSAFDDGRPTSAAIIWGLLSAHGKRATTQKPYRDETSSPMLTSPTVPETSFKQNPRASGASSGPSPMSPNGDEGVSGGAALLSPTSTGEEFMRVETFASPSPAASPDRHPKNHVRAETVRRQQPVGNESIAMVTHTTAPAAHQHPQQVTFVGEDSNLDTPFKTQFLPSALMALTTDNISRSRYDEGAEDDDDDDDGVAVPKRASANHPQQHQPRRLEMGALQTSVATKSAANKGSGSDVESRLLQRRTASSTSVAAHQPSGLTSFPALSSIMDARTHNESEIDQQADGHESDGGGGVGLLSPPNAVDTSYPLVGTTDPLGRHHNVKQLNDANKKGVDAATEVERFIRLVVSATAPSQGAAAIRDAAQSVVSAQVNHLVNQIGEEVQRVQLRDLAIHKAAVGPPLPSQPMGRHPPSTTAATGGGRDEQELALHLYSLKQQVIMLSHMTSAIASQQQQQQQGGGGGILMQSSADFGASAYLRASGRRNGGPGGAGGGNAGRAAGGVTVHVVRDYDAPIVAYKKSSIAPPGAVASTNAAHQQPQFSSKPPISGRGAAGGVSTSFNAAQSSQYSSDFVTTTGSVSLPRRSYASGGNFSASIGEESLVMASSSWAGR